MFSQRTPIWTALDKTSIYTLIWTAISILWMSVMWSTAKKEWKEMGNWSLLRMLTSTVKWRKFFHLHQSALKRGLQKDHFGYTPESRVRVEVIRRTTCPSIHRNAEPGCKPQEKRCRKGKRKRRLNEENNQWSLVCRNLGWTDKKGPTKERKQETS